MWASCFADARCRPRLDRTGTKLHHSFGMWPLLIDDTTEAIEIEPSRRLVLEARGWLVSKARVEITVNAAANGSLVSIAETSQTALRQLVPQPGTSGRHRRTQPQDAASARLPRRRPHVSGSARPKRRRTPVGRTPT